MLIEACVDSVDDALAAQAAGARRVELCADLYAGGTTPSAGLIQTVAAKVSIPVFVMIRPRGGDFLYNASEVEVMLRDAADAPGFGAHGVVSGALNRDATIDRHATAALIEASKPLPFTFHRAFDFSPDLAESLDTLIALGCTRILSSGGAPTAIEGRDALAQLAQRASARIALIGGGGVRSNNIATLARVTGLSEFHIGARRKVASTTHPKASIRIARASDELAHEALDIAELGAASAALAALTSTSRP